MSISLTRNIGVVDSTCWRSRETKEKDEKVVSAGIEVLWLLPRGIYD